MRNIHMNEFIGELHDLSNKETAQRDVRAAKISTAPSEALCGYVVLFRTLALEKEFSIVCMQELMRRRELGDEFDFESFIEEKCKDIPIPKGKLQPLGQYK